MNQLRRKGRSKCRNSKLRKSRRKTRVKRQYKRTTSRVKRNTYRKNRKRRSTRKMRGGKKVDPEELVRRRELMLAEAEWYKDDLKRQLAEKERFEAVRQREQEGALEEYQVDFDRRQDKQKQLLAKWKKYQPSESEYKRSRKITPYSMDLGQGVLRKEAEKVKNVTPEDVTPDMIQTQMNLYLEEIIQNFPNLERLDISGNDLHYLPRNFGLLGLARLKSLNIKGNPKLLTNPESKRILDILYEGREDFNIEGDPRFVSVLKD